MAKRRIYKVITPEGILYDIEPDNTYGKDDVLVYIDYTIVKKNPTMKDINKACRESQ